MYQLIPIGWLCYVILLILAYFLSTSYISCWKVLLRRFVFFSFQLFPFLLHIFWGSVVWCMYIEDHYIFLVDWFFYNFIMSLSGYSNFLLPWNLFCVMNVAASALKKTSFLNVCSRCDNIFVQQYILIDILPLQVNVETLFPLGLFSLPSLKI